jgi:hypothetical protein
MQFPFVLGVVPKTICHLGVDKIQRPHWEFKERQEVNRDTSKTSFD